MAAETGILERLYTVDLGITRVLIEQGIDAALIPPWATDRTPTEVVAILQDHCNANVERPHHWVRLHIKNGQTGPWLRL